jgi:hypothetical protein
VDEVDEVDEADAMSRKTSRFTLQGVQADNRKSRTLRAATRES